MMRGYPTMEGGRYLVARAVFAVAVTVFVSLFLLLVSRHLEQRRFWAWVAAIVFFSLMLDTWFFPLGVLGLWGLLTKGTRAEFMGVQNSEPGPREAGVAIS